MYAYQIIATNKRDTITKGFKFYEFKNQEFEHLIKLFMSKAQDPLTIGVV